MRAPMQSKLTWKFEERLTRSHVAVTYLLFLEGTIFGSDQSRCTHQIRVMTQGASGRYSRSRQLWNALRQTNFLDAYMKQI